MRCARRLRLTAGLAYPRFMPNGPGPGSQRCLGLLPGPSGVALLDAARSAFVDAFQVAASCSGAIVTVAAVRSHWCCGSTR